MNADSNGLDFQKRWLKGERIAVEPMTQPRAGRREWIGLAVLVLPTLLISMDLTVLHLALPSLSADLQPTSAQLLWIVDIYGFMIAGSLITMGTLGDRIGRRKLLLIGAAAFGLTSILAAFANSAESLIACRALLGVAGATLMPSTMALIRNMFLDPGQRTVAIGVWISGFSAGSAIGPLVGGLLLERFWWGSVFLLNVPVMAVLLIAGPLLLPEHRDPNAGRLDLLSAGQSLVGVLLVIFGLKQITIAGAGGQPLLAVLAGAAILALFVRRQRRLADPLIDLRLFRVPAFSASLATNTLGIFLVFGTQLFVAQYLQLVAGLSPSQAGLWMTPGAVAFIVGSNLAPVLARRARPATLVAGGMAVAAASFALLTQAADGALPVVIVSWAVASLSFGVTFTITSDLIVGTAPPERAGSAAAISETGSEFGGALGIALIGSLGMAVYRSRVTAGLPAGIPAEIAQAASDTLGAALAAAEELPGVLGARLVDLSQGAFLDALQVTALIAAVGLAATALLAGVLLRGVGGGAQPEEEMDALPEPQQAG
jgi:DHA2 family multidrug resistance protein-like MFS transporter